MLAIRRQETENFGNPFNPNGLFIFHVGGNTHPLPSNPAHNYPTPSYLVLDTSCRGL